MSQQNYEAEVKRVMPDAVCITSHSGFKVTIWSSNRGDAIRVVYRYDCTEAECWQHCHETLKKQGKI